MASGLSLTDSDKLTGENYFIWRAKIRPVLMAKGVWEIVESEPPEPSPENEKKLLKEKKGLALAVIVLSVAEHIIPEISSASTPHEAWKILQTTYDQRNLARVMNLKKELYNIKMEGNESVNNFLTRLKAMLEKLQSAGIKLTGQEVNELILDRLPPSFESFVAGSAWSNVDLGQISFEEMKGKLLTYEQRLCKMDPASLEAAFATKMQIQEQHGKSNPGRYRSTSRGPYRGNFSRGRGRGFSPGRGFNQRLICFYCGKPGHYAVDCRIRRGDIERGLPVQGNFTLEKTKESEEHDSVERAFFTATVSQVHAPSDWYINSGAS